MCQGCLKAVNKHYPHLNDREQGELLMGATCFPFGKPEQVEEQLAQLRRVTDGSLGHALWWAERDTERQMRWAQIREQIFGVPT